MSEVVDLVKNAGVVGAGGAGFPTHAKLSAQADIVIINGAECEPLLRVDQQLMAEKAKKLVKGVEAMLKATGAPKAVIALKKKYKDALEALSYAIEGKPISLFRLNDFFPAGDEQVLVYEVTGRVVPEGGIPLKVGCVVSNVETAVNVADALEGIPVTDKYITVTGEVRNPITVKIPIGTPISEVLALAGVIDMKGMALIDGGPMMGAVVTDFSKPVTKTTKGLIVLSEKHPLIEKKTLSMEHIIKRSRSACIQCVMCTDICPRNMLGHRLSPHKIMRSLNFGKPDEEIMKTTFLCCECGACELYACPMQLSPRLINAALKKELGAQGLRFNPREGQNPVSPVRDYRKIPSKRLVSRLALTHYDRPAPLSESNFLPGKVSIPLRQHIGAPSVPVVKTGQLVEKGTLIAEIPEGALGANIHASISGMVKEIAGCIVIESGGERGVEV